MSDCECYRLSYQKVFEQPQSNFETPFSDFEPPLNQKNVFGKVGEWFGEIKYAYALKPVFLNIQWV